MPIRITHKDELRFKDLDDNGILVRVILCKITEFFYSNSKISSLSYKALIGDFNCENYGRHYRNRKMIYYFSNSYRTRSDSVFADNYQDSLSKYFNIDFNLIKL